jgi:hypothetical protein
LKLEQLQKGARIRGLAVEGVATVKSIEFHGQNAVEVIFTDAQGGLHTRLLSRDEEPSLDLVEATRPWSFDADGDLFRLVSEARRIDLAWLFDPYVAITSSTIEPLPSGRPPPHSDARDTRRSHRAKAIAVVRNRTSVARCLGAGRS